MEKVKIHDLYFKPMISAASIAARTREMGVNLSESLKDQSPLFISVLNGAFIFAADLIRHFSGDCEIAFVQLSSYEGTQSTGVIDVVQGIAAEKIKDRHLVVVEDILDSGRTLHYFIAFLKTYQPASVRTVTLLRKPEAVKFVVPISEVGFDIEDKFVVGYGLDYKGLGRNLPEIFVLDASP